MMADLLAVETLVLISVSVAGLLSHLPHYFWNKIWWAFWKKIEKLKRRIIAQYNSWFLDTPKWVLTAESLTCLELHSDVLCYFNEEDWRQRDKGYLSPNHAWVCARRPEVCSGCQCRPLVGTLGDTVSPQSCAILLPLSWGWLSFPFPSISLRAGRCGSLELKIRNQFLVIWMGMAGMGRRLELAEG